MDLRHLRYFVAVAEEENVTRAAARLRVSQPPLSRQIRDLEETLGLQLFHRGPKSVRLTDAGRVFLDEARGVLRRVDEALQVAKAIASGQSGEIRIGYAPSLAVEILPAALRIFQQASPGVRVQLHDLSTRDMLRGLGEKSLDVALMIQPSPETLDGLAFEELRRHTICVAIHPAHPLGRGRKVDLEAVAKERLIGYTVADYPEYRAFLASVFARLGRPPRIVEEHDSSTSLIAAVEAGRGIALVQQGFECFTGARLKVRPLSPDLPPFVVGMAHRRDASALSTINFLKAARLVRKTSGDRGGEG